MKEDALACILPLLLHFCFNLRPHLEWKTFERKKLFPEKVSLWRKQLFRLLTANFLGICEILFFRRVETLKSETLSKSLNKFSSFVLFRSKYNFYFWFLIFFLTITAKAVFWWAPWWCSFVSIALICYLVSKKIIDFILFKLVLWK